MRARGSSLGLMLLLFCTAIGITTEILPVGLLPSMTRDLQVSGQTAGLLVSAYALVVAVFAIPLTRITGRFRRKQLLIATVVGYGVSSLLVAAGPTFAWVAAGRALGGIAHALFFAVSNAYATRLVAPERQGRAIAFVSIGASVGYLGAVPVSTALGTAFGWRVSFLLIGGLSILLAVLVGVLLPAVANTAPSDGEPVHPERFRALRIVATSNVLIFFAQYSLYTFVALLFLRAGIPEAGIGPSLFLLAAGGLVGLLLAGRGLDHRMTTVLVVAQLVAALGVGITGLLGGSPVGVLVGSTIWLAGFGALAPSFAAACIRTGAFSPDMGAAINNAASNAGLAVGAAAGGVILTGGGVVASVLVSSGVFVVAALVLLIGRPAFTNA